MQEVLVDISRLVRRFDRPTLTGVDRVVLAYAKFFRGRSADRTRFVHTAGGKISLLSRRTADLVLNRADGQSSPRPETRWSFLGSEHMRKASLHCDLGKGFIKGLLREVKAPSASASPRKPVYFTLAHGALEADGVVHRLHGRGLASCVAFLHDLIPLSHPEYVVPRTTRLHDQRLRTMATCCDLVIANSAETRADFIDYTARNGLPTPPVVGAHLGIESQWLDRRATAQPPEGRPYFVMLGTIEPRKNHLLLLNVWRVLYERFGDEAPRLHIVGRRGWENENVIDMLDRSPSIARSVVERTDMDDTELIALLRGARALLFPSFAEGYGLPLIEALALGVPVIASDLRVFREVAGDVPDYADPIDGRRWLDLVNSYCEMPSRVRADQMDRIRTFEPTTWQAHFEAISPHLRRLGV